MLASRFAHIRYIKRSMGASACRVAAYNARTRITCRATQRIFDFSERPGLAHHTILLPPQTSSRFLSPETLWNAVEASEKRKDSQVAKELLLRLPEGIPSLAWMVRATHAFITHQFVNERIVAQVDIHSPPYQEKCNWHAHILMPLRRIHQNGLAFVPYKAVDLEPCLRGAQSMAITTTGITDKWCDFLEQFCAKHHFPILTAHTGPGRLRSEGPRYKKTPDDIAQHNADVLVQRARHHADPIATMRHLLRKQDMFSLDDLARLWGIHTPEETLRHEFLQDLIRHSACFGLKNTHLGLFSSQDLAQRIPLLYAFIRNHQNVIIQTCKDLPHTHRSILPKKPKGTTVLTGAHNHPISTLSQAIQDAPDASWILQGNAQKGSSCVLWGTSHQRPSFHIVSGNATQHLLHHWHKAFRSNTSACLITHTTQHAQKLTNAARSFLKNTGILDNQDIYMATPLGPQPFARNDHILHNTGATLIPATVHNLSLTEITLKSGEKIYPLDTREVLPLSHAYVRHHPPHKAPSFAVYTPPLTPPPFCENTHIITSANYFDSAHLAQTAIHTTRNRSWAPNIHLVATNTFTQQLAHALEDHKETSLSTLLQDCLQHSKNLPLGVQHIAALKMLFVRVWSQRDATGLAQTITPQVHFFMAAWKSAQHPLTPQHALRIEQQFFSGVQNDLWSQRHNHEAYKTLLSLRHKAQLTPQQEHWAHLATHQAFSATPHDHQWSYYQACHKQEWCFYHLMHSGVLPTTHGGLSAFYSHNLHTKSHALFNSPLEHKTLQHQL